ncbi:S-methyl-5-thioribose-1-phosphate isomerase [Streptomyces sp. DSM 44915]|uniref:Multifunctional fusion protein n=1 Tax=Streptomyces chisholmiae TaxID=3075540 RepID=A0ABU2JWS6_9ACTN|nr:S-methyl-5-thioribose-1-phosphate isomerase [Streptomyces sp. DSM 44915]MDT0269461.1 S-methyl-5-thioribose-1-phosphate isomerase [Streptomyces sp. DSM 44915]
MTSQPATSAREFSVDWADGAVLAIDQRRLPAETSWLRLTDVDQVIEAIQTLAVRGAPAIGLAGALGVALSAHLHAGAGPAADARVRADAERLIASRPTAVNLEWGVRRVLTRLPDGPAAVLAEAVAMLDEDAALNTRAVARAAELVLSLTPDRPLRLLTHCNTGRLATGSVGTALGAVRRLADAGRVAEVLVDETRPLLQGARLTAWELAEAGVPYRVLADSAAAAAMAQGLVDCVLVGADRIAANGDTANKIGTYGLAVAAARHGIPFVVVAPESTWDRQLPDGSGIVVEERASEEVTTFAGARTTPEGAGAYNPAFDVTPAELITAVVTERQVFRPAGGRTTPAATAGQATTPGPAATSEATAVPEATATSEATATPEATDGEVAARIVGLLRGYPDHPRPGVVFQDLSPLYAEPGLLAELADRADALFAGAYDRVLAVESRGFVLGAVIAARRGVPLTLARKPGKLPGATHQAAYTLEYGTDSLELQRDAVAPGDRVLVVDDVLATGGTLAAVAELVAAADAKVAGMAVVVELTGLGGAERLADHRVAALSEVAA